MNWQKSLAFVGVGLLFLGSLWPLYTTGFFHWFLDMNVWLRPADRHIEDGLGIPDTSAICDVIPAKQVKNIHIDASFPLTITVKPKNGKTCHADVSISAPAFVVSPESQTLEFHDGDVNQAKTYTFLLVPKQVGIQLVGVNFEGRQDILYYEVKPKEFIPAWMTSFISPVLSVFGPMLTIPWWIDRRDKKREAAKKKAEQEAKKPALIVP